MAHATSASSLHGLLAEFDSAEALLRAAAIVIECELPLTREHADAISKLTGESIEIEPRQARLRDAYTRPQHA